MPDAEAAPRRRSTDGDRGENDQCVHHSSAGRRPQL
jgi:hypothetical protein